MQSTHTQPKMKSRQATLRAVLSLAFLGVLAGNAKAAVYTFSFSNVDGAVSGTVSGTITLPDGDGTFAATSIVVTSAPTALGYTTPFDVFTVMNLHVENSFTVLGGNIVLASSTFGRQTPQSAFTLNYLAFGSMLTTVAGASPSSGVQDASDSTLIYGGGGSSVPDAGPGPALALLLGGLGLRQWRSSRRAPAAS